MRLRGAVDAAAAAAAGVVDAMPGKQSAAARASRSAVRGLFIRFPRLVRRADAPGDVQGMPSAVARHGDVGLYRVLRRR
jgi:hypothetical protein